MGQGYLGNFTISNNPKFYKIPKKLFKSPKIQEKYETFI
jgi:hypothetical protein